MEWTRDKTLEFISSYKSYPVLWDCNEEFYKDRFKRHEALEELAKQFGTLTTEVERKIKNLQSHFLRERKRLLLSKKNTTCWFAYKPLSFLLTRNKEETRSRLRPVATHPPRLVPVADPTTPHQAQQIFQSTTSSYEPRASVGVQDKVPESYSAMKEMLNWFKERDEFDLYGEQIAIKLRNITSPLARVTVQNRMNMLLMQAELGMFDTDQEYASSSMDFCPITKVEVIETTAT